MAVFDDLDDFNPQDQKLLNNLAQSGTMLSFEEVQTGARGDNPFDYSAPFSANDGTSNLPYVDKYVSQNVVMKSFSGINARYIEQNYFSGAKSHNINKNVSIIYEAECDKDILLKESNLYINRDGTPGYQAGGEDKWLGKIYVFVSRNGNKLDHIYIESEKGIGKEEIYFFLEDNTGDFSNQVLYARFGSEKLRQDILNAGDSLEKIYSAVPGLDRDMLNELIRNGKVEAKPFLLRALTFGIVGTGLVAFAIPKAVGWVITQIGNIIEENLKIPERIWDSHSDDYFLDKHSLIRELQINTEFLNTIDSILKKDNPFIQIIITPFGKRIVETNVQFVKHLVNQYNTYVEKFVDEVYNRYQGIVKASDFIFNHSEAFAFFCGLWNGLVDFIADIFKFIGVILETPFDLINNFQYFLESLDNFLDALKNFSIVDIFMSITFVQVYVLSELIKFFKSDNIQEEYNLDKIAYYTGYAVGFILSLFIPFLDLATIAKVGNVTKVTRVVPDEYLKAIASKSGEVPKKSGQLIKLLDDLAEFLGKKAKGKSFNDEIKKILDDAVEYIKKNKKTFSLVDKVDNAILPLIKILNRNPGYVKCVELVKGKHGRHLGQWIAIESEAMVKLYTANIYIRLNKALRGIDNVKLDKELKAMQNVLDDALEKLPVSTHNNEILQRSVFLTEKEIKTMFKIGKDYTEKGFMSTTYSERALMQWLIDNPTHNVIFKVQGKNGKLIEKASMLPMENEVLFKSGTNFVVESVKPIPKPTNTMETVIEIILKEK